MAEYDIEGEVEEVLGRDDEVGAQPKLRQRSMSSKKAREYPLGFTVGPVADAASGLATSTPQVTFRPERLVVPGEYRFLINSFTIGIQPQFASGSPVHAGTFLPAAFGVRLKLDTAQSNQPIQLSVTNVSGSPATFYATLLGPAYA